MRIKLILVCILIIINSCKTKNNITHSNLETNNNIMFYYYDIESEYAYNLIYSNLITNLIIIDIRTPYEYQEYHISNSININYYSEDFINKISVFDKDNIYLIYCRSGNRSSKAIEIFKNLSFKKIYNLKYGIIDWINKGYPVITNREGNNYE